MILEIHNNKTIENIRNEFSEIFPCLGLEFYDEPHKIQEASSNKDQYPHHLKLGEIRKKDNPGMLEIHPWSKTSVIEKEFKSRFGLNVQIFRQHKDKWIQTVGTDELTLKEQNEIGINTKKDSLHGSNRHIEKEKFL